MKQKDKTPIWRSGIQMSLIVFLTSLFFGRGTILFGEPLALWGMLVGLLMFVACIVLGIVAAVSHRRAKMAQEAQGEQDPDAVSSAA